MEVNSKNLVPTYLNDGIEIIYEMVIGYLVFFLIFFWLLTTCAKVMLGGLGMSTLVSLFALS